MVFRDPEPLSLGLYNSTIYRTPEKEFSQTVIYCNYCCCCCYDDDDADDDDDDDYDDDYEDDDDDVY